MSNKLPFEDAFKNKMNDLPPGNEDASWQKMKQLLEEQEKRKPFAWLNIYTVCTGIIILAAFGIWMMLSGNIHQKNIAKTENSSSRKNNMITIKKPEPNKTTSALKPGETNETSIQINKADTFSKQKNTSVTELNAIRGKHVSLHKNTKLENFNKLSSAQANQRNNKNFTENLSQVPVNEKGNLNIVPTTNSDSLQYINNTNQIISTNSSVKGKTEPSFPATEKNDSLKIQTHAASDLKQPSNVDTISIKKQLSIPLKQKHFFVEAGIQLKQQIPLGGQKIIAYNYNGDKALFTDYIPAVFIKFEKDKQWFFQGEFSYATPQLIKQFSYSRQTKVDYSLSTVTVTTANLQKTYYHKMPLSFNYYLQPHWSIGTGIEFSWFRGAVAEQEITTNDLKANISTTTNTLIPFKNFTDSFLYKNQASLLIQTSYSLKRWSFILRFKKGFQPYIKYTLPNGFTESKTISSLELNIGYRLIRKPF
jgi:hypothetical protein